MSICDEDNLIRIVKDLNQKPKEKSITSSIHTMALCVCLENMKPLHPEKIVSILSPIQIDCIDTAEVVYRLIKFHGSGIQDLGNVISDVLTTCFQSEALIAKRAISSLAELGRFADRAQFEVMMAQIEYSYKKSLKLAEGNFEVIPHVYKTKSQLYSCIFQVNPSKLPFFINQILRTTKDEILAPDTAVDQEEAYDRQSCLDNVRIYAFVMLTEIASIADLDDFQCKFLVSMCNHFFAYGQDDLMEESDAESMESFEDSEEYEQSITWKIRLESVKLAGIIVSKKPQNLPLVFSHLPVSCIRDENAMVACEAVKTFTAALKMVFPYYKVALYTQIDRLATLQVINQSDSLYSALFSKCLDPALWVTALETLIIVAQPKNVRRFIHFARSVVSGQPLMRLYGALVQYGSHQLIVEDLVASLQPECPHAVVSEAVKTCFALMICDQPSSLLGPLQRICVSKAYPLESRRLALETLQYYQDESVCETIYICLGYSSLAETACDVFYNTLSHSKKWVDPLCDRLKELMKDPDNAFCIPAIAQMSKDDPEILQLILSMHTPKKYAVDACYAVGNFFGEKGLGLKKQVVEFLESHPLDDFVCGFPFAVEKIIQQRDMIPLLLNSPSPLVRAAICVYNKLPVPESSLRYAMQLGYPVDKGSILKYDSETAGIAMMLSEEFFLTEFFQSQDDAFFLRAYVSAFRTNPEIMVDLSSAIVGKVQTYSLIKETEISLAAECLSLAKCLSFPDESSDAVDFLMASTVKLIISSEVDENGEFVQRLQNLVKRVCDLVMHSNLSVKQAAVNGLMVSLHNNALVILPVLSVKLSELMEKELVSKKEYTRVLQIGPFKHKIDDGLELRKSLYEMVYTILIVAEKDPEISWIASINYYDILNMFITKGLKDDNSVVQLCCITIQKLAALHPELFVEPGIIPNLIKYASRILKRSLKETATKQELEKHAESTRAISRTFAKVDLLQLEPHDRTDWVKCKQDLADKLIC